MGTQQKPKERKGKLFHRDGKRVVKVVEEQLGSYDSLSAGCLQLFRSVEAACKMKGYCLFTVLIHMQNVKEIRMRKVKELVCGYFVLQTVTICLNQMVNHKTDTLLNLGVKFELKFIYSDKHHSAIESDYYDQIPISY